MLFILEDVGLYFVHVWLPADATMRRWAVVLPVNLALHNRPAWLLE